MLGVEVDGWLQEEALLIDLSDEREEEMDRRTSRVSVVILALQGGYGWQSGHGRVMGF
jgi:hypothetical protein